MNIDTAGNPIFSVPAYCGQCCAPTNTAGVCPNGCEGSPIVTAKVAEDWKALAEERGREIDRLRAEYEALRAAVNASGDCTDPEHGESCACHADVMLRNLHAEVERLRKLNDEQRISDAKTYTEMLKRKETEIERLRAEKERLRSSHCDCRERAEQAEARLERVVEEMGERILALRAAHHDGDEVTWENAVKLAVDALAKSKEE